MREWTLRDECLLMRQRHADMHPVAAILPMVQGCAYLAVFISIAY